jgi:hypothetical protein
VVLGAHLKGGYLGRSGSVLRPDNRRDTSEVQPMNGWFWPVVIWLCVATAVTVIVLRIRQSPKCPTRTRNMVYNRRRR